MTRSNHSFRLALAASVGTLLLTTACFDYAPIYAGQARGSDVALALVTDGADTTLYVCGGADTVTTHTRWFAGTGDPRGATMTQDRWTVSIDALDGAAASGILRAPAGQQLPFTLAATTDTPLTRLYAMNQGPCRLGVIAYADEAGNGQVQGAYCDEEGDVVGQVTPVDVGPDNAVVEIRPGGVLEQVAPPVLSELENL